MAITTTAGFQQKVRKLLQQAGIMVLQMATPRWSRQGLRVKARTPQTAKITIEVLDIDAARIAAEGAAVALRGAGLEADIVEVDDAEVGVIVRVNVSVPGANL